APNHQSHLTLLLLITATSPTTSHVTSPTHLHFYWHNNVNATSPDRTAVVAVPKVSQSPFSFGSITIMDDPITSGPTRDSPRDSPLVGRAQGVYIGASQSTFGLLMAMNFVFVGGEYNGSSLAIMGRNEVPLKVRELPVVGGTGVFRLAKGYALLKTYLFHVEAGIAVVEYNVYVWH
ncbi:Dirigent protein 21, partial [Linum perenne]